MAVLLWSLLTLAAYASSLMLYRRSGHKLLFLPVLVGTALVVAALLATGTPYEAYAQATKALRWLTGPAIIALAVPLYRQARLLREAAGPLTAALVVGCLTAVASTSLLARALGAPREFMLALVSKSATMPIAMATAERVGGIPALAAMGVVATGVLGTLMTGPLLRSLRINDPHTHSFTLGLTAHAIGTARAMQSHPQAVAFAALAMSLNGVATAVAVGALQRWL